MTLLELLRFYPEKYMQLNGHLEGLEAEINGDEVIGNQDLTELTGKRLLLSDIRAKDAGDILRWCRQLCDEINLQVCVKHTDELLALVKEKLLGAEDVRTLKANVHREIGCHFFVGVPADRRENFTASRNGWEDIATRFPSAADDIEEMNKCFALCRYPAAVFHSLIVVEHGLVALGKALKVTDPKEGWDASCKKLAEVVKHGHAANDSGLSFQWLEQVNACVQTMKLAWRNKVNHATGKPVVMTGGFAPDVSDEIMTATRSFMRRLGEQVTGAQQVVTLN